MLPGDPPAWLLARDADETTVQLVRQELGLDKPLPEQFVHFFSRAWCKATSVRRCARDVPWRWRLASASCPPLLLTISSMAWSVVFGMGSGIISAVYAIGGPTVWG